MEQKPRRLEQFYKLFLQSKKTSLLDILNVKYVIEEKQGVENAIENPNNLGVAWFVEKLIFEKNADSIYKNLLKYDLSETAIIETTNIKNISYSNEKRISQIKLLKNKPQEKVYSIQNLINLALLFFQKCFILGGKPKLMVKNLKYIELILF